MKVHIRPLFSYFFDYVHFTVSETATTMSPFTMGKYVSCNISVFNSHITTYSWG